MAASRVVLNGFSQWATLLPPAGTDIDVWQSLGDLHHRAGQEIAESEFRLNQSGDRAGAREGSQPMGLTASIVAATT